MTITKDTGELRVEVKALADGPYPHGEFVAVLSTPTTDRDNEVVAAKAFDPLPDHITIDIDHGLKASAVVGSGTPYYEGDTLMVKGRFASTPEGQRMRALVNEGHIRTMSVAFRKAEKEEKDGATVIRKAELLNAAFVSIPANREALVVSAKAGRTLSAENEDRVRQIVRLGQELLTGLATEERQESDEETAEGETEKSPDELAELRLRTQALTLRSRALTLS